MHFNRQIERSSHWFSAYFATASPIVHRAEAMAVPARCVRGPLKTGAETVSGPGAHARGGREQSWVSSIYLKLFLNVYPELTTPTLVIPYRFSASLNAARYVVVSDNNVELTQMMAGSRFLHGDDGPDEAEGLYELPSPDTRRWVVRRKAVVVQAVRNGAITLQEACRRYSLSVEEFLAWQRAIDRYGIPGLRVTRLQIYRDTDEARAGK